MNVLSMVSMSGTSNVSSTIGDTPDLKHFGLHGHCVAGMGVFERQQGQEEGVRMNVDMDTAVHLFNEWGLYETVIAIVRWRQR